MLSIRKFQDFLFKHSFVLLKFFVQGPICYAEIISLMGEHVLVHIDLNQHSLKDYGDIPVIHLKPFTPRTDPMALEKIAELYEQIDVHVDIAGSKDMKNVLNSTYGAINHVDNSDASLTMNYQSMRRLTFRLKSCLSAIQYGIAVIRDPLVTMLHVEDTDENQVQSMVMENGAAVNARLKMYLIIDIELFYNKAVGIAAEIREIEAEIHRVLTNNQRHHNKSLQTIWSLKDTFVRSEVDSLRTKSTYREYIEKFQGILDEIDAQEKALLKEKSTSVRTGRLEALDRKKRNFIQSLVDIKVQHDDLALTIDSVLFDNILLMEQVLLNLKRLTDLIG